MNVYSVFALSLCLLLALLPEQLRAEEVAPAKLYRVREFCLGGAGFSGETTDGEKVFRAILARTDNLEVFLKVYANGNNQAQMYAMTAFYYLDRKLYDHIKADYKDQTIRINHTVGCYVVVDSLTKILTDFIEKGYYDRYVPKELRPDRRP